MTKNKKILIIEDEKPLTMALELKLKGAGFDVDIAYDGVEGVDKLYKNKYDLVLLDLIMPRKDGFTVLAEMKAKNDKTPVIALTNLSQKEDLDKVRTFGVNKYFVKSDTPLYQVVSEIQKFFQK
jgi:DNA-binding response OmpR family regulator